MSIIENQQPQSMDNVPPPGYPTLESPKGMKKKKFYRINKKGDGFLRGCLAALCCCWICQECCI